MKRTINRLVNTLREKKLKLALAESITAGLATHGLCGIKGICDVMEGSIVCYNENVKTGLLGLPESAIKKYTAESKEVTGLLAKKLRSKIKAQVHAAVTGLAAAGGSETRNKPVGTVFFAVWYKGKLHHGRKLYRGSPAQIRKKACNGLYAFILDVVS